MLKKRDKFIKQFKDFKPLVQSDSFEALRAAAASGALAALLPKKVALRSSHFKASGQLNHDLVEIPLPQSFKHKGEHKIFVISQMSCDRNETHFLADECQKLLKN